MCSRKSFCCSSGNNHRTYWTFQSQNEMILKITFHIIIQTIYRIKQKIFEGGAEGKRDKATIGVQRRRKGSNTRDSVQNTCWSRAAFKVQKKRPVTGSDLRSHAPQPPASSRVSNTFNLKLRQEGRFFYRCFYCDSRRRISYNVSVRMFWFSFKDER